MDRHVRAIVSHRLPNAEELEAGCGDWLECCQAYTHADDCSVSFRAWRVVEQIFDHLCATCVTSRCALCEPQQRAHALIVATLNCSPASAAPVVDKGSCIKCGHFSTIDIHDEGLCQVRGQSGFICGCKCEFTAACAKCGHSAGVERTLKRCKARIDGGEALCQCHCVFPAAATAAPQVSNDFLRDAGAIIIVNEGSAGARVEIRFAELQDAQRLHQALAQMRAAAPVEQSDSSIPTCPDCQQGYICEHCGKSIIDYYSGNEGAR